MASTYLNKTFASAGNRKTWTFSTWVKRSALSSSNHLTLLQANHSSTPWFVFGFYEDKIELAQTAGVSAGWQGSSVFRDVSAWYHLVLVVDTTSATTTMNGSSTDRMRVYVNNEQIVLTGGSVPSQNSDLQINNSVAHTIGGYGLGRYFDGVMAHIHFIDGTAYDASAFGETDATTGIWKPKTAPSVTYGTNGFFLKFENSGAFGTDSSGNGNNFTVNGTMTQTIDTPSNVFATINPLSSYYFGGTFSNGNNKIVTNASNESYAITTLGVSSGKWYWEVKDLATQDYEFIGIVDQQASATNFASYQNSNAISYYSRTGGYVLSGGASQTYGNVYGTNDIIGVALDLDNNKLYFSKNGTWQNSGDPTSGATGTGAISIGSTPSDGVWYAQAGEIYTGSSTFEFNFGNGYFGTTAVSSAQNPDDGIGIFEYDVPNGYRALCTKSINAEEYS